MLLQLPHDVLRHCIFTPQLMDTTELFLARMLCRRLRSLIDRPPPLKISSFQVIQPMNLLLLQAAQQGYAGLLEWGLNHGGRIDSLLYGEGSMHSLCCLAARHGHLAALQLAHMRGAAWHCTCESAARGGHLEVLQWARKAGAAWNCNTCAEAARGGHLHVLQWARANGAPWNEDTCLFAAAENHLDVLQWARANGAPWDAYLCAATARQGHLETLQWALANGCPWNRGWVLGMAEESRVRPWLLGLPDILRGVSPLPPYRAATTLATPIPNIAPTAPATGEYRTMQTTASRLGQETTPASLA
jgi:hypothetical protein